MGPGHTPMMISWRKYVDTYDEDELEPDVEPESEEPPLDAAGADAPTDAAAF